MIPVLVAGTTWDNSGVIPGAGRITEDLQLSTRGKVVSGWVSR